jgi:hypothetical protein
MNIYNILIHLHSVLRWALLVFVILAIILSIWKRRSDIPSGFTNLKASLWAMATAHLQLLTGFVLYFISPKVIFDATSMQNPVLRFYLVEHILVMLIAIALITLGYINAKKTAENKKRNRLIIIYFLIALLLMLSRIPWPFLGYGGGWI